MGIFGWRPDAIVAFEACNDELRRMHKLLHENIADLHIDMTKAELMDRIVKLQDTVNEGVRKLCGLEH